MALKRAAENREASTKVASPGAMLDGKAVILDYMTQTQWEDGELRTTATLLLFAEEGTWKACLNDRANARSAWVSGLTPEACIEALEEGLETGEISWRASKGMPPRPGARNSGN